MRKYIISAIVVLSTFSLLFAGGLVMNTNQSASFMRSLNRNASTDLDAAFFNPAALTLLNDGMHVYLSNQSIFQTRTITNDSPYLNNGTYEGTTDAPLFPNAYFIFKTGKMAFAGGFAPIGGGGSANFDSGLPSFELPLAQTAAALAAAGVTGYSLDAWFEGSSTYLGFQGTVSYQLNDAVSIAVGGRMIQATNEYKGELNDLMVKAGGADLTVGTVLRGVAAQYTAGANGAQAQSDAYQDSADKYTALSAYYAGLATTFSGAADAVSAAMTANSLPGATPLATLEAVLGNNDLSNGLTAAGVDPTGFDLDATVTAYTTLAAQASGGSALAAGGAAQYQYGADAYAHAADSVYAIAAGYTAQAAGADIQTADLAVEAKQTGSAFAPIFGINIKASDKVNIGFRYEGTAKLEMKTDNPEGDPRLAVMAPQFVDGAKFNADMPGMFAAGISYQVMPKLNLQSSFNYYFNSNADWDGKEKHTVGGWEAGLSAHYALTNSLELSCGYLTGDNGAFDSYNSDLSNSLNSSTYAAGFKFALGSKLFVEGGYADTQYVEGTNKAGNETYMKTSKAMAIGVGLSL